MKKVMKALALALALCMALSVSAFAELATTPEANVVNAETRTVAFTITGVPADEQVALMILADGTTPAAADKDTILYIDQTKATAEGASFDAVIKEGVDKVDVYVGSTTISQTTAWEVYPDLEIGKVSSIALASGTNVKILEPGEGDGKTGTEQYGIAIKMEIKNLAVEKMIWALGDGAGNKVYSKPIMLNYNDFELLEGATWFTAAVANGVIGEGENQLSTIQTVNAIFRCNGENYFTDNSDVDKEGNK